MTLAFRSAFLSRACDECCFGRPAIFDECSDRSFDGRSGVRRYESQRRVKRISTARFASGLGLTRLLKTVLQFQVQAFNFLTSQVGFFGSVLCARGKLTNRYCCDQECEKSNPVLGIIDNESMKRRKEEEIETGYSQQRRQDCRLGSPRVATKSVINNSARATVTGLI